MQVVALLLPLKPTQHTCQNNISNRNKVSDCHHIPVAARFYDLIYHPKETVFLRYGRKTGHRTMNGKNMIDRQAVIAFCRRFCRRQLQSLGKDTAATQREVAEVMLANW